jgi:CheY-like chemotaxis protein
MSRTIDSSLLFLGEDGTQAFSHDTNLEFFLAKALIERAIPISDIWSSIKRETFYQFYSGLLENSDELVKEILSSYEGQQKVDDVVSCLHESIKNANGISSLKGVVNLVAENHDYFTSYNRLCKILELCSVIDFKSFLKLPFYYNKLKTEKNSFLPSYFLYILSERLNDESILQSNLNKYLKNYMRLDFFDKTDQVNLLSMISKMNNKSSGKFLLEKTSQQTIWQYSIDMLIKQHNPLVINILMEKLRIGRQNKLKPRLLHVDDDSLLLRLTYDFFEYTGYDCISVRTSEEALSFLNNYPFDLIISDVSRPGLGGIGFIREAKKIYSGPILILSARSAMGDFFEEIGVDFIAKPCSPEELISKLDSIFQRTKTSFLLRDYIKKGIATIGVSAIPYLEPYLKDDNVLLRTDAHYFIDMLKN